jgi:hypothetical protein
MPLWFAELSALVILGLCFLPGIISIRRYPARKRAIPPGLVASFCLVGSVLFLCLQSLVEQGISWRILAHSLIILLYLSWLIVKVTQLKMPSFTKYRLLRWFESFGQD